MAIADTVQPPEPGKAAGKDAVAPLGVDVVFEIARKRGHDLDRGMSEKLSKVLETGLLENCQVTAIDDVHVQRARRGDKMSEARMELGSPSSDVQGRNLAGGEDLENRLDGAMIHFFAPIGSCIDMTMQATLIAAISKVDLQRCQTPTPNCRKSTGAKTWQHAVHGTVPLCWSLQFWPLTPPGPVTPVRGNQAPHVFGPAAVGSHGGVRYGRLTMTWLDRLPMSLLLIAALTLGLAPFVPEPHLVEKLRMLHQGTLTRPIDIFDLVMHATPWALLGLKLGRMALARRSQ